jgi:hypothetical protein
VNIVSLICLHGAIRQLKLGRRRGFRQSNDAAKGGKERGKDAGVDQEVPNKRSSGYQGGPGTVGAKRGTYRLRKRTDSERLHQEV